MPDKLTVYHDGYADGWEGRDDFEVSGEPELVAEYWRGNAQGKADREEVERSGSSNT